MIPAKTQCPNWTLEYDGYLGAERYDLGRTMYECVDKAPESVPGLNAFGSPLSHFYSVEPYCNGLSCPPMMLGKSSLVQFALVESTKTAPKWVWTDSV